MDWSDWMSLTPEQCSAKLRAYRDEIARERDDLRAHPGRLDAAVAGRTTSTGGYHGAR